ncbi:MAG: hypothetical protein KQJ78_13330, partial [Deltaproteobacteria bacterium]|nr:hypothetical protein [Deltaproteobacteria bacterium]
PFCEQKGVFPHTPFPQKNFIYLNVLRDDHLRDACLADLGKMTKTSHGTNTPPRSWEAGGGIALTHS